MSEIRPSGVGRCEPRDPRKPFVALAPKTRLVLAEQAGPGPLIPVMTKLILVMAAAAAAQSGDRRLRLTVRGGWGEAGWRMMNIRLDRVDLGRWVR